MGGAIKRYLTVLAVILGGIAGVGLWLKPKPGEVKEKVENAMIAYAHAQAASKGLAPDLSLPTQISHERDWLVAVSYSASTAKGEAFSCWGAFRITFCASPDEPDEQEHK